MKSRFLAVTAVIATTLLSASMTAVASHAKREFRSTWFTTHVNIDWPRVKGNSASIIKSQKDDLINYLNGFEKMNLNGICFQVRAQTDAVYRSSYEPWSAVMTGTRGLDPGWDPLEYAIEECHKRGLECYAWINPFRWSNGPDYNTPQDQEFKAKGWVLGWGSYYVLNPAIPEVREHILKVCQEIVDKYALDGVLFDDYFYPNNIPENSQAGDWELYEASGKKMSIGDWRRENINLFVREFKKMVEKNHPDMRFGISPAGVAGKSASKFGVEPVFSPVTASDWQYSTIYSDPLAWLYEGSIDFISPQIYWTTKHATAPYEPLCNWWSYVADKFGRHFYSSQSVSFLNGANTTSNWKEVATQVEINRKYSEGKELDNCGTIYFSSKYFNGPTCSGLGDYLMNGVYADKALVPVVTWKERTWFEAPKNLNYNGTKLTWDKIDAPRSIMRYTVYAFPTTVTIDEAADPEGDGLNIKYLEKVCYDNSFEVPAAHREGYWYAVCAYDGLGYEYAPAIAYYPEGESEKVTLLSPADGAKATWTQKFEWSSVSNAHYTVKFSTDPKFTAARIDYPSETSSLIIDLDEFTPSTTYYWQVSTSQPGKLPSVSETRSFVSPALTPAPKTTLISPENGASPESDIKFEWAPVEGVTSYTLEVSSAETFDKTVYSTVTGADLTKVNVNPSLLGRGKFFWRVVTDGPRMTPTASDVRILTIEKLSIGLTEPGYTIVREQTSYPSVNGINIENLWIRSNDNHNISFEENGLMERSMVAVGDYVYLTHRSENSVGARLLLEKYDGLTGEHVSTLTLGSEGNVAFYPMNTVMKDDDDNILISNLTLNAVTTPVLVHLVNLNDGSLTEVASIDLSGIDKARIDHVSISGSVNSGDFTIMFPISSQNKAVRVLFKDGKAGEPEMVTFSNFFPAYCTSFGIAPFITPINSNEFLVNGGGIGLARYSFASKEMTESLADATSVSAGATTANGSDMFALGTRSYVVYPAADHKGAEGGFQFSIAATENGSLSGLKEIAIVPQNGLGTIDSSTASTPISSVKESNGVQRVYVYSVGNGLAAYRVTDTKASVGSISHDSPVTATSNGLTVNFNRTVENVALYTLAGAKVAEANHSESISAPAPGAYILKAEHLVLRVVLH